MSTPLVDIVVLVHDQWKWADLCIRAVEHQTKNPYRLILVDNASEQPETIEGLKLAEKRGHTVVRLNENRSFSNGVNAGVNAGESKFVVVLNDDAIVTEGWDTALLQDASRSDVGMVGARSNFAAGPMGDPSFVGEPPFLVFVCVCFRRDVWKKVGPLDEETFDGFSCEDLDYSWRVVKNGFKLKVSSAFVYHAGSRTLLAEAVGNAQDRQLALAKNNEKYQRKLQEKWGKDWIEQHTKLKQKVLVTSYHAEEWTRVKFAGSLVMLKAGAPAGQGGSGADAAQYGFTYYQHTRTPIHLARQLVCDYACNNGFDVLIQIDDDATFPPDLIRRLLAHDKEVVTALAYQRKTPYLPCIYEKSSDKPEDVTGSPIEGWENTGLRRVDVSGYHVSALRMSVIKKMRAAGITQYFGGFENKVGEDFAFSHNLKKVDVPLYCDTNLVVGHIAEGIVIDEAYKAKFRAGQAQ